MQATRLSRAELDAVFRCDDRLWATGPRGYFVDPEITRREVVARITSGEYRNISFIHEISDGSVLDITSDILAEVTLPQVEPEEIDLQALRFDHRRDLGKHAPDEDCAVDGSVD
jgi:hypothetical protein